jgi:K+-transporting ATPase ATPase C chain
MRGTPMFAFSEILPSLRMLIVLSVLTGIAYPLVMTGIAQVAFPHAANGSLIVVDGKTVGSDLIGQPFDDPKYFWSRPSTTSPQPYNGASSSGSNQGPTNPALADAVKDRIKALRDADPDNKAPVPVDLVTASGSGLDPNISVAAARYQLPRVAKVRGLSAEKVQRLVDQNTEGRTFGVLGEPRVNVLALNLALDRAGSKQ